MAKSENDFVNEAFSEEELATMAAGDAGSDPSPEPGLADGGNAEVIAPEPEAKAGDEAKLVDVRALQEARASERALREEMARKGEYYARLEERAEMLAAAIHAQTEAGKPKPVSKDDDIVAFYDNEIASLKTQLESFNKQQQEQQQAAQRQREEQAIVDRAQVYHNNAMQKHPDVKEAVDFTLAAAQQEIRAQVERGELAPEHAGAKYSKYVFNLCASAPADPDEFARFSRSYARFWGWNGSTQQQSTQAPNVQEIAARQERHMSLSGVSGGEPPAPVDAKALATMSDDDFKALMKTAGGRKQVEQIMGG